MVLLDALVPRIGADDAELYGEEQKAFNDWRSDSTRVHDVLAAEGLDKPAEEMSDVEKTDVWRIRFANANIFHIERWRQMEGGQVFYDQAAGSAAGQSMNANAGWDFLDDLSAHPYPVTVLIGDHDLVGFGGRLHRRQLEPLANVTFVMLENAGHNAWVDRPAAFRAALVAGLERAARGRVIADVD
jgi:pimeloyl-ACP methyl ester carboxylesterase